MKNFKVLLFTALFISSICLTVLEPYANPDIETFRPNAVGTYSNNEPDPTQDNYLCVDEVTADDDTTYVAGTSTGSYTDDSYNIPAHTASGTINSVKIYTTVWKKGNGLSKHLIVTYSTVFTAAISGQADQTWETFDYTWTDNPNTATTWTWTEIDDMEIGVSLLDGGGGPNHRAWCTQVYIEVDYTAAGPDTEVPNITNPGTDPVTPVKETDDVKIYATITDNIDVVYAYCLTRINLGSWNNYTMTEGASDEWYYQSGTYSVGDDVDWYIQAKDAVYNSNTTSNYGFNVTDQTAPDITVPDHDPDAPTESDYITFDCTITDNVDVTNAFALYRVDAASWNNETMSEGASNLWSFTTAITFNIGELIEYWFKARDAVSNWKTLDNEGSYYSFYITDQNDPVITSPGTDPVTPVKETDDVKIYATITDNDDVVYAFCLIRINLASWNNYSMTEGASDEWYYQSGTYSVGDDVDWYIQAKDNVPNSVVSSTFGFNVTDQTLPVISSPEHSPSTPKETDSVILRATCTDNDDVTYAFVFWQVDGGGFTNSSMTEGASDVWNYDIGTHAIGVLIQYWFKARDAAYNWQTLDNSGSYYSFYITDQDDPNISGEVYDPDPALYTDNIQINATVTDNDVVKNASVWYRVDAGSWSEYNMSKDGNIYYYTIGSFNTGEYIEYFIEAYDNAENGVNGSIHGFYITEQDPPVITNVVQLPSSPVTELQTIQINATVTDAYLDKVLLVWRVDGGSWTNASMSNIEGDIWTYTIGAFSIGSDIDYYIFANDTYANEQTSSTFGFNVTDQTNPVISNPGHEPDNPDHQDSVILSATITDNDDVIYAYALIQINEGSWNNYTMTEGASDVWSYDSGTYSLGTNVSYYFQAKDAAYNSETSSTFYFNVTDSENPVLSNIDHIPDSPTELQTVEITCTATDNDDISFVTLYWKIDAGEYNSVNMTEDGDNYSTTIGTFNAGETIYYYLKAVDPSTNYAQSSEYNFVIQEVYEGPQLNSPANISYQEGTSGHIIIWIVIDSDSDNYSVQCNAVAYENGTWESEVPINVNVNGLTAGFSGTRTYNFTIIVQDLASNTAFDTVLVTVSKNSEYTIPIPTTNTPPPEEGLSLEIKIFLGVVLTIVFLGCIFVYKEKEDEKEKS